MCSVGDDLQQVGNRHSMRVAYLPLFVKHYNACLSNVSESKHGGATTVFISETIQGLT